MRRQTKRALTLLLALVLCLGLLPMAAMASETSKGDLEHVEVITDTTGVNAGGGGLEHVEVITDVTGSRTDGEPGNQAARYRVVFYVDLSGGQGYANLAVNAQGKLDSFPTPPTRDGYVFVKWVETQGGPAITKDHVFTGDTKLFGEWEAQAPSGEYVLKLDPNGGTCSKEGVKLSMDGHTAPTLEEALPTPTREGYTFEGWFVGDREVKAGFASGGNETAVAKWSKAGAQDPARVDFIPNGGTITSIRGIPAKDIVAGSEQATKNNIFVDRNSGIGMMMTGADGRLDDFPEIEREGYVLDGWYLVGKSAQSNAYAGKEVDIPSSAKKADLSTVFTSDALLAAKWTEKSSSKDGPFTVKFDLNYKDPKQDEIPKEKTVTKGDVCGLPDGSKLTPPASNYEFYAWCVEGKDGKLYPWKETNPVTADMTLYAGWVKKGTVVKNGQAIDAKPVETQKPAETAKPETPAAPAFTDVAATSPFAPAISWAVEKGITNGKTATTFGPGDPCTRAQIVTFLWRAAGSPEPKTLEGEYADVTNKDAYFYKAVQWAAEMGMEESGTFKPSDPCTRGQAMYFIWKARAGASSAGSAPHFTDLNKDSLYYDAVLWAVGQGVTNGTGDGTTFSPDNPCTRGQIVTFLYRAYEQ